jgi:ABC transporter, substrate-binding protein, aliphatic sulfonates family
MKKKILFALGLGMMVALSACSTQKQSEETTKAAAEETTKAEEAKTDAETTKEEAKETFDTVKVRVAYMPNMGSASLATTAKEKGFFKDMGLDVEMVEFQGGPAEIAAMASGDIDISQIGHGAHALCIEGQAKVFELDCTSLADAVIANKKKGIEKLEDLKGKKVAVTSGTSAEIILNLALDKAGLKSSDLDLVEMDANGIVSAIVSGNVDACATWSPGTGTILEALKDDGLVLATNEDYVDKVTFPSSFITTEKYASENKDVLVRFARALQKAADYRSENIEEVAKMVAKQCQVDEEVMLKSTGEGNWISGKDLAKYLEDGTVKEYYENQQKVFIDSGRIKEAVDVDKYVMFDIMQEAADANAK